MLVCAGWISAYFLHKFGLLEYASEATFEVLAFWTLGQLNISKLLQGQMESYYRRHCCLSTSINNIEAQCQLCQLKVKLVR